MQHEDPSYCDPNIDDGWHWYPVDPNPTLRRQERFNELWDETQNHVDLYTFSIYDTSDGMPKRDVRRRSVGALLHCQSTLVSKLMMVKQTTPCVRT